MNRWIWRAGALAFLVCAWILFGTLAPVAEPGPAAAVPRDRADVASMVDSVCDCAGEAINPECRARVILADSIAGRAGARAPVVLLLHGFTNCPKQFEGLGRDLARKGYTVVIPLLPRHGRADVMTTELSRLDADELVRAGERSLDVARRLGGPVSVMGLSSSAVLTGWLAQHRDVDGAVLIAPALGPKGVPASLVRPLASAMLRIPNFYVWWDSRLREKLPGPRQCYPRFSSRAIAQVYRLGASVLEDALRAKPRARRIVIVTTEEDDAVNNDLCAELGRSWRERGARVETVRFPKAARIHHDMIDPEQPYQRTEAVYPVLERLVASSR